MIDLSNHSSGSVKKDPEGWKAEEIFAAVVCVILWSAILLGWMGVWG